MAEGTGEFVLSIDVEANMAPFNASLKQGLDQAAKGTVVPLGTSGGGAGMPAAQQAAVDRAMGRMEMARPGMAGRLPGGYIPQPGIAGSVPAGAPGSVWGPAGAAMSADAKLAAMQTYFSKTGDRLDTLTAQHDASRQRMVQNYETRAQQSVDVAMTRATGNVSSNAMAGAAVIGGVGARGAGTGAAASTRDRSFALARGAVGLYGFAQVAGDMASLGRAEMEAGRGDVALLQARHQAIRGQALYQPLSMLDMSLRGLTGRNMLGGFSPLEFEQRAAGAERSQQLLQARVGAMSMRRGIDSEVAGGDAALATAMLPGGFQRRIRGNVERFNATRQQMQDEMAALQDQRNATTDPGKRDEIQLQLNVLQQRFGARQNAALKQLGAANEELFRESKRRYQELSGSLPALGAAGERRFGEARELEFRESLVRAQRSADEEAEPGMPDLVRRVNLKEAMARTARQTSELMSRQADTGANQLRLRRSNELTAQLMILKDRERVEVENAERPEDADAIRQDYRTRAQLSIQQFEDRRFDIRQSISSATRQSEFRTKGGSTNRVLANLDAIISATRSEALGLEREGLTGEAKQRRRLGQQQVRELKAEFFRAIQFEETSLGGDRIATSRGGSNATSGLERVFRNAEQQAGVPGKSDEASLGPKADTIIGLIRQMLERHFTARAG